MVVQELFSSSPTLVVATWNWVATFIESFHVLADFLCIGARLDSISKLQINSESFRCSRGISMDQRFEQVRRFCQFVFIDQPRCSHHVDQRTFDRQNGELL